MPLSIRIILKNLIVYRNVSIRLLAFFFKFDSSNKKAKLHDKLKVQQNNDFLKLNVPVFLVGNSFN